MKIKRKTSGTVIPGRPFPSETLKLSKALADLAFQHTLDTAIKSIQDSYLFTDTLSIEDISHKVLTEAKRLTGSGFGFAGYIDPATGWFIPVTLTRDISDKCRIKEKSVVFKEFTGLWGWVLKNKKPLLTNSARADRRSSGVPKGHIKVEKFLAAPAVFNRRLAGMLALANPAGDYSPRDLSAARKLAHIYAMILQRKFAEDRLKAGEEKLRAIVDNSRDIIYSVNPGGFITYMSRQARKYGYDPQKLVGRHMLEFAHPDDRPRLQEALARAIRTGKTAPLLAYRLRKKDGSYFFAEQRSGVIIKNGRAESISAVIRDVTDSRLLEKQILESEKKYKALFENANAAIFLADAETGTLLDANRRAELLTGRTRAELTGMNQQLLHPARDKDYYKKHFAGHVMKGGAELDEAVVARKDGTEVAVQISAAVMQLGGKKVILGIFEDVTERKKAVDALHDSERKIRGLFDHTSHFLGMLTPNGRLIEANGTALDFAGITREDCLGKYFWDTAWWRHSAELRKTLRRAVAKAAKGESVFFEATHPAADGSLHYVEFSLKPVRDAGGRVLFLIPEGRDITERRRLTLELAESRERFKALVETTGDWVWETDMKGVYTYASPQVERILGYRPEELVGKTPFDIMPPEEAKRIRKIFEQHVAAGESITGLENLNLHRDGRGVVLETNGTPFHGPDGRLLGYRGIDRDITERRRLEGELRENEETLRKIFDNATDAIFLKGPDSRYLKVNRAAAAIFGMLPEEMKGKTDLEIFPEEQAMRDVKEDQEVLRTGVSRNIEKPVMIKGREYFLSAIKTPLMDPDGKPAGILGIVRDVTELKKMEEQLINAKAVAKAGKITGDAAHDFNNILSAINGYAAMILDELNDKNPIKPDILEIVKAVRRATALTEKLQVLSKAPDKNT